MSWTKEQQAARREQNLRGALAYLGGRCVVCGSDTDLQFDHIDRATKCFEIAKHSACRWETLVVELDKCQLLCKKHHAMKTSVDLGVDHGGGVSGKKNCPCDACRDRKREYMRAYMHRRRRMKDMSG